MNTDRFALPIWETFELLRSATIGRLCVIEQAYPIAVPINYRIIGSLLESRIVFRTAPNSLLGRYEGLASLEVDHLDELELETAADDDARRCGSAWSVIVRGTLAKVHDHAVLPDPHPLVSEGRHQWLILETSSISGRRFTIRSAADGVSIDWRPVD